LLQQQERLSIQEFRLFENPARKNDSYLKLGGFIDFEVPHITKQDDLNYFFERNIF